MNYPTDEYLNQLINNLLIDDEVCAYKLHEIGDYISLIYGGENCIEELSAKVLMEYIDTDDTFPGDTISSRQFAPRLKESIYHYINQ